MKNKKLKALTVAIITAVGGASLPQTATADVYTFNWAGTFAWLDAAGTIVENSSIPSNNNTYITPVSGTLTYDTDSGTGSATMIAFDFWGTPGYEHAGITLEHIGDGVGGSGSLILANMLASHNNNNNMPVSIVMDGEGLLSAIDNGVPGGTVSGTGAIPAIDGYYLGATVPGTVIGPGGYPGYMGLGPTPLATTAWDTTPLCSPGSCIGENPSGGLPLVLDVAPNTGDYIANTGGTIPGYPMIDGPFSGMSTSIDIASLTLTGVTISPGTTVSRLQTWTRANDTNGGSEKLYVQMSDNPGNWIVSDSNKNWAIANILLTGYAANFNGDIALVTIPFGCAFCPASEEATDVMVTKDTFPLTNRVNSISALSIEGFPFGWSTIMVNGTEAMITTSGDSMMTAMAAMAKSADVSYATRSVYVFNTTTNMLELQSGWLQELITN